MLILAMNFIFIACILYTLAVWSEKIQSRLKLWHMVVFWLGFVFDTIGTTAMAINAGSLFQFNFHGITGLSAILVMLFHSSWASMVLYKKDEIRIVQFHKFSFFVWLIWLIPMVTGMIFGASM